jgi:hypothetical protein
MVGNNIIIGEKIKSNSIKECLLNLKITVIQKIKWKQKSNSPLEEGARGIEF